MAAATRGAEAVRVPGEIEKGLTTVRWRWESVDGGRIGAQQQRFIIRLDGALFAFSVVVLGREVGGIHWFPGFSHEVKWHE